MKKVDVIDKYLQAKASGDSEEKAQLFARSWAESMEIHSDAATKQDLKNLEGATKKDLEAALESFMAKLEVKFSSINARFVILTTLGSLMFVTICLPYLQKLFVR